MEVAPAILASTITTLVIFLPLIFVRGISGILFTEMAYVIIFSLTCSLLVALSLVPMLTSRLLGIKPRDKNRSALSILFSLSESLFLAFQHGYSRILTLALNRRWIPLMATAAALGGALMLVPKSARNFFHPVMKGKCGSLEKWR